MLLKNALRVVARKVRSSSAYLFAQITLDQLAAISTRRGDHPNHRNYHLHLPSTGGGNIGDQAMLDAYLQSVEGPILLIMEDRDALRVGLDDKPRVTVVILPGIVSSAAGLRGRQIRKFMTLLADAKTFSVAGADVMDGLYNASQSIARVSLLKLANSRGVPTSILGFSWSDNAVPSARRALGLLDGKTRLCARDPKTVERLKMDSIEGVVPVADGVFSLIPTDVVPDVSQWIEEQAEKGRRVAVVNASGLIGARMDQHQEYSVLLDELHHLDYSVLFVPHVIRNGDDDLQECQRLFDLHGRSRDFIVQETLAPSQIRHIVASAALVVTGRMHLAIMSLSCVTPVVTLGTQGKVEGLYQMFGLTQLLVMPQPGFGLAIRGLIREISKKEELFRGAIQSSLPSVLELSSKNYSQFAT